MCPFTDATHFGVTQLLTTTATHGFKICGFLPLGSRHEARRMTCAEALPERLLEAPKTIPALRADCVFFPVFCFWLRLFFGSQAWPCACLGNEVQSLLSGGATLILSLFLPQHGWPEGERKHPKVWLRNPVGRLALGIHGCFVQGTPLPRCLGGAYLAFRGMASKAMSTAF